MKREIIYRVLRIIFVIVFVSFLSIARNGVKASYDEADTIIANMPSFKVTQLSNNVDYSYGLKEEHSIKIENISNKKQNVSFVLQNTNKNFPYNYMNYTIIKDSKVVKEGVITKEGIIYQTDISFNDDDIYKIVLTISQKDINALGGISTHAEFIFI